MLFFIVFIAVLFFYIHIYSHLKTNNDTDIIYIDYCSCEYVQEMCDQRQPVHFVLNTQDSMDKINRAIELYPEHTIQLHKLHNQMIPIKTSSLNTKSVEYVSYQNQEFLQNTGLIDTVQLLDAYIRPITSLYSSYDIMFLSINSHIAFEYNLSYRTFIRVGKGKIKIKLIPPKCKKYMYPVDSFSSFRFYSPINPWNVQSEYRNGYDKVTSTEIELNSNEVIYIPSYWYYSIQAIEESIMTKHIYWTFMNILSVAPTFVLCGLEKQL
jgi:hypothetical protein